MPRIVSQWIAITLAILLIPSLNSGVRVDSPGVALLAAATLGILNTVIRPILLLLTLPLTVLSLGIFILVINALMFKWAGSLVSGFHVDSFMSAVWASLVVSIVTLVFNGMAPGRRWNVHVSRFPGGASERPTSRTTNPRGEVERNGSTIELEQKDDGVWR